MSRVRGREKGRSRLPDEWGTPPHFPIPAGAGVGGATFGQMPRPERRGTLLKSICMHLNVGCLLPVESH